MHTRIIGSCLVVYLALFCMVQAKYAPKSEEDFLQSSDNCLKRDNLGNEYKAKFDAYVFSDEPAVHKFVHCVWQNMGLWQDGEGFNVEHIADLYKDRANPDILVPILTECNRNKNNEPAMKWCYDGFICMLNSRVGQWFKDDVNAKKKEIKQ